MTSFGKPPPADLELFAVEPFTDGESVPAGTSGADVESVPDGKSGSRGGWGESSASLGEGGGVGEGGARTWRWGAIGGVESAGGRGAHPARPLEAEAGALRVEG